MTTSRPAPQAEHESVNERIAAASAEGKQGKPDCDHGVTFDEEEANKLLSNWKGPASPAEFIMGNPISSEVRKRWPRLFGRCPKGCGYEGIYYASYAHYIAGDW